MTPDDIWRRKSDDEVVAALMHMEDYTPIGQAVISREATRRGIKVTSPQSLTTREREAMGGAQGVEEQASEPKPTPGSGLEICTIVWVVVFFSLLILQPWAVELPDIGVDLPDPMMTVMTGVVCGLGLAQWWADYFKKKAEWERRHNRSPRSHSE